MQKILVVDDDYSVAWLVRKIISPHKNIKCVSCQTGRQALDLIEFEVQIVAAWIDVQLPDINGLELYQTIKEKCPDITASIITGFKFEYESMVESLGAYAFVRKPVQFDQLSQITYEMLKAG